MKKNMLHCLILITKYRGYRDAPAFGAVAVLWEDWSFVFSRKVGHLQLPGAPRETVPSFGLRRHTPGMWQAHKQKHINRNKSIGSPIQSRHPWIHIYKQH